jgi:hypothetical protein
MDDRCHEARREIGGFLDLAAGGAEDKGEKKGSESAQVAFGFVRLQAWWISPLPIATRTGHALPC